MAPQIRSEDVPQERSLRHLRALVQALNDGCRNKDEIAKILQRHERHVDYFLAAARTLGFVEGKLSTASVTEAGRALLDTPPESLPEANCFIEAIHRSRTLQSIAPDLLVDASITKAALAKRISEVADVAATTAESRAGALLAWRDYLVAFQPSLFRVPRTPPSADGSSPTQPDAKRAPMTTRDPFKSEIRPSTLKQLLEKVKQGNYGKYLRSLAIKKLRGIDGERVTFDFPVTALIGPNGEGKTTVLGAAACAYQAVKPRQYFAKSGKFDESMKDWSVEYEAIDRQANPKGSVRRSANFVSSKWSRKALQRPVLAFGVARTVPASERAELRRCAAGTFSVSADSIQPLTEQVAVAVERILGRSVKAFNHIRVDPKGRISLLSGATASGVVYSEFHFGAGESSIIRMVMKIEDSPENALILIEEIENGLHPVATIRMVEYLIDVADRKRAQTIFTTHSNDALRPLPSEAIWATVGGRVFQGKLDIHALRALTGRVEAQIVVFVEDAFASDWILAMLRAQAPEYIEFVEIHAMQGDGAAVEVHLHHNTSPASHGKSFCFIDGDSRQREDTGKLVFRLPGEAPEAYVYDAIVDRLDQCCGELAVALHQRFEAQDVVSAAVKDIRSTNRDRHIIFNQVGRRLGFIAEAVVRSAFLTTWAKYHSDECARAIAPLVEYLKKYFPVGPGSSSAQSFGASHAQLSSE